jgi:hypothetical protein
MIQMEHSRGDFERNFESLMQRLLRAGMIQSYDIDHTPHVVWNDRYDSRLGGRSAFLGLAAMLAELCESSLLSEDEQALIQLLAAEESEGNLPGPGETPHS